MQQDSCVEDATWYAQPYLEPKLEVESLDGREAAAIGIVGALVDNDDAWQPLAQFGLVWTGGLLGPLAAQALYHGHALRDGSMAL